MKIIANDVYSQLVTDDLSALAVVRGVCRARPNGFYFMPKYKNGHWDGYISLMDGSRFPTGLLELVRRTLQGKGYAVDVEHPEHVPPQTPVITSDALQGITLRPYQVDAAQRLLEAKRGVAKMATNSGKTEVMAALIQAISKMSIVVLHRKELLHQTAERLQQRLGPDVVVGKIGDGIKEYGCDVTVAMIQTLSNIIEKEPIGNYFSRNMVVMVDECHNASSDQMLDTLYKIPGQYRYGFSGTPLKHDDLSDLKLISITGPILTNVTNEDLIEQGYSARPVVHVHVVHTPGDAVWEMDYHEAYQEQVVENKQRNGIIRDIAGDADGVVLVIVKRIEHGKILQDMIPGAMFACGSDNTEHRQRIISKMRSGRPGTYVATSIFDEGVDVPAVNTLIIAAAGKSHVKLLQRVGRGLRQKDGENVLYVHDFLDDTNEYLLNQSEARIDIYERERFECKVLKASDSPIL